MRRRNAACIPKVKPVAPSVIVNLSAKTEYACIAVLELAARYASDEPVRIRDIAEKHGVPSRFLVQILLQLKGLGIVASTRGAAGGYQLVRPPSEITLEQVMSAMEGTMEIKSNATVSTPITRTLAKAWQQLVTEQRVFLQGITFGDLTDQLREQTEEMYYI